MPADLITELHHGRKISIFPFFDQMPPAPRYQPNDPPLFSQVEGRIYHLDMTAGQIGHGNTPVAGTIRPGAGPNPALRVKWLPYVAGSITYTSVNNTIPILTGRMTGCWLATFQLRGQTFLAHVGTDDVSPANTEAVKSAWKISVHSGMIAPPFKAFNPIDHIANGAADFGAINASGQFHAISFDIASGTVYVVKQVRHVTSPDAAPNFK